MFELSAARTERRKETPGGRSAFFMGNKRGRKDGGGGMLTCLRVRVGREGTVLQPDIADNNKRQKCAMAIASTYLWNASAAKVCSRERAALFLGSSGNMCRGVGSQSPGPPPPPLAPTFWLEQASFLQSNV